MFCCAGKVIPLYLRFLDLNVNSTPLKIRGDIMIPSRPGGNDANEPQQVVGGGIKQFDVYIDRNERIGKVVDLLTSEADNSRFLVVDLDSKLANKQIVLPFNSVLIDQRSRRIAVTGLSKAQILDLPAYRFSSDSRSTGIVEGVSSEKQIRPPLLNNVSLEDSAPLEASVPLDYKETVADQIVTKQTDMPVAGVPAPTEYSVFNQAAPVNETFTEQSVESKEPLHPINQTITPTSEPRLTSESLETPRVAERPVNPSPIPSTESRLTPEAIETSKVVEGETIRLLKERLIVDRKKIKVGEVIVRKEIETQTVQVPVRREKLVIEQISPEHKQLATFAVGQSAIDGVEIAGHSSSALQPTVSGEFASAKAASQFLDAIANRPEPGYQRIRIEIVLDNADLQENYQQWLDHYSASNRIQFEP